jgi:hypothetical protein
LKPALTRERRRFHIGGNFPIDVTPPALRISSPLFSLARREAVGTGGNGLSPVATTARRLDPGDLKHRFHAQTSSGLPA